LASPVEWAKPKPLKKEVGPKIGTGQYR